MSYIYLIAAIVSEVIATSFMKQSEGFTKISPSLITITGYAAAFYCLSQTVRSIPTGVVYAIWSGLGIVLISAVAWVFQGQKLDAPTLLGMSMIVGGVVVMNVFSNTTSH